MLIVFDLDGTLIDSIDDLTNATNAVRSHFGLSNLDRDVVQSYVGNGVPALLRKALGEDASPPEVERGRTLFLDVYSQHCLDYTSLYPGVKDLLEDLRGMKHSLAVLSNKPENLSKQILDGLRVGKYFFRICGGDTFSSLKPDPTGLLALMAEKGSQERDTLVIGDSPVDVHTARHVGARSCGVLWGFQAHAIQTAAPDLVIGKPHQLLAFI